MRQGGTGDEASWMMDRGCRSAGGGPAAAADMGDWNGCRRLGDRGEGRRAWTEESGRPPAGVSGNGLSGRGDKALRYDSWHCVDDRRDPVLGVAGRHAGPFRLEAWRGVVFITPTTIFRSALFTRVPLRHDGDVSGKAAPTRRAGGKRTSVSAQSDLLRSVGASLAGR